MSSGSPLRRAGSNSSLAVLESGFEAAGSEEYQTKGQYATLLSNNNHDLLIEEDVTSSDQKPNAFVSAPVRQVNNNMQKLERWMFRHLLKITLISQTFVLLVIRWFHPKAFAFDRNRNVSIEAFCWFSEIALAVCNTIANINAARSIMNAYVSLSSLIQLYISNTIVFAGLYFSCFLVDQFSFRLQTDFSDHGPSATFIIFWYFSFATQSTSGFGDIIPRRFVSQALTSMQMLISVLYSVAIFAVGTTHIRIQHELNARESVRRVESSFDIEAITGRFSNQFERYIPGYHLLSVFIRKAPLLLTCLTMLLCLLIVIIFKVDFSDILQPSAKLVFTALFVLMLQCANFIVVMTTSFILVRKINAEDVTPEFLIQSYLSTALLFGGMYFTIYVIEGPSSFHLVPSDLQGKNIAQLIFHFGYFAISAQTGCGFGDIYPLSISTRLVVSFHFLVSMIYTAIILGLGLSNLVDRIIPGRILASAKNLNRPVVLQTRPVPLSKSDDTESI